MLGLGQLHSRGIIHRDIKLENLMLDANGYIKIIDFGLAKHLEDNETANTMCGTLEYFAPEIVKHGDYDKGVDWWAVGIMIYEMLFGVSPFSHKKRKALLSNIKNSNINFPDRDTYSFEYTDVVADLITKLLEKDPTQRLGHTNDALEILEHPWFTNIDLEAIEAMEIQAPIKPDANGCIGDLDLSNFNVKDSSQGMEESIIPVNSINLID